MYLDKAGILNTAQFIASPNSDERPPDISISLLVIHNISLPPGEFDGSAVIDFFTNRLDFQQHPFFHNLSELKVSAHFFIRRNGKTIQFVPCSKRAWHAGASSWLGQERCNDFSIGIELEGSDHTAFTDEQYASLYALTQCLCARYPIEHIAGHSDIAPTRKTDPGPYFDWSRFASLVNEKKYFIDKPV